MSSTMISSVRYIIIAAVLVSAALQMRAQSAGDTLPVKDRPELQIARLSINSSDDDFAPVPLRGGEMLVYTSSAPGPFGSSGHQRIWMATRTATGWSLPLATGEAISRANHVGSATLTPDGNFMIFAAYEWEDDSLAGYGRTDLYSADLVQGEWRNIKNLGPIVNSSSWDTQPTLTPDGRTLYFSSDRPGGHGGSDIYVSHLSASGWSVPVNVGEPINTSDDDLTPTIAPDGKSLFFASRGHGGVGGFDLFVATKPDETGTKWRTIENLGTPINSSGNDYYFVSIANSRNSYVSSDRGGNLDIFTVYPNPFPPEALVTVAGNVLDIKTRRPVAADITVTDLSSGEVVANYRTDDRSGEYFVVLPRGHRYSITAQAPDYIFYSDEYAIRPDAEGKDLKKDIELYRTSGGTTRLLVFFDFDKAELKNESKPDLNRAIEFLKNNPNISVEIAGHTDSVGVEAYNKKLSQDRAEAVRSYVIAGGIDPGRVISRGYGEEQPAADNSTEEGRARNRRVEMRVNEGGAGSVESTPRR
jgi:outer membrane protein OmpA-like peptidoglycan-associated protein/Tol biopolymer transport system component